MGRKKKALYRSFFTRFIPAVVGPELFRQRLQDDTKGLSADTICTVSDEAFALLLIENSYDRWQDIYTTNGGMPKQRRGDRTKQLDSEIPPKYTHGGIKYTARETSQSKGWSDEGIKRYNELYALVSRDRLNHPNFMVKFKTKSQETVGAKTQKKEQETVKAVHSLWVDDNASPILKLDDEDSSDESSTSSGE